MDEINSSTPPENTLGNGGSPQVLIGRTYVTNAIIDPETDYTYSCDNLRISLKFPPRQFARIQTLLDTWSGVDEIYSGTSNKLAGYRCWWVYKFQESSINIGIGWNQPGGKVDEGKGYLDFNPNKLDEQGRALIRYLSREHVKASVKRWDLAIDCPVDREEVRLIRDSRRYDCTISAAMTEYLGQRSTPGYVKVYDKTAEASLDFPLTRVELTCDGEWSADDILGQLPKCYFLGSNDFNDLARTTKVVALMCQSIEAEGGVIEPWLHLLNPRTRTKIRNSLRNDVAITYSRECVEKIAKQVHGWELISS